MALVRKLAASMAANRHEPLVDAEPSPTADGQFQIVCGEQRWRAAREAGRTEILVRVHPPLGYRQRLERQFEENLLRAGLDPVEEAQCLMFHKILADIEVAEDHLRRAGIEVDPLETRRIDTREQLAEHLDELKQQMLSHGVHVMRVGESDIVGTLSPWRVTEAALGVSEASRKAKVGILRLDPELREQIRDLPTEHAVQIARLPERRQQEELAARASELTHQQVRGAVERFREEPDVDVETALAARPAASEPPTHNHQVAQLNDLSRQLCRVLGNLRARAQGDERDQVLGVLDSLTEAIAMFAEAR